MGIYGSAFNPWGSYNAWSNPYASLSNNASFGAPGGGRPDPFQSYNDFALGLAVGRFFSNAAGGGMNNFAPQPGLEFGLRNMMQQMNQCGPLGMGQPSSMMPGAQDMQQFGQLIVMMALCMMLSQQMNNMNGGGNNGGGMNRGTNGGMPGGGRDLGPQMGGGNWGGGRQVNGGWPPAGTDNGGPVGPMGTINGGSGTGQQLAQCAARTGMSMGTVGRCYAGAKQSIARGTGVQLEGGSAYMAAPQLARSGRFTEVSVSQSQLNRLPAGAVVVWGQTGASPHGHISVALGDGRESSDHVQRQITSLRGASNYRVFVPSDMA